jgi:hypothetical protein
MDSATNIPARRLFMDFIDDRQLAAEAHRSLRTIRRWRAEGLLPPHDVAVGRLRLTRLTKVENALAGKCIDQRRRG